jgi:hypothetical protein
MKNRKRINPFRHRRHIPYGSKGHCKYGGEYYLFKYKEEFISDIIDKKSYRQKIKYLLQKIKDEYMNKEELEEKKENCNDSEYKEDRESDPDLDD